MEQLFLCDTPRQNQSSKTKNNPSLRPSPATRSTSYDELLDYRYKQYYAHVEYGRRFPSYQYCQVGVNEFGSSKDLISPNSLFFLFSSFLLNFLKISNPMSLSAVLLSFIWIIDHCLAIISSIVCHLFLSQFNFYLRTITPIVKVGKKFVSSFWFEFLVRDFGRSFCSKLKENQSESIDYSMNHRFQIFIYALSGFWLPTTFFWVFLYLYVSYFVFPLISLYCSNRIICE